MKVEKVEKELHVIFDEDDFNNIVQIGEILVKDGKFQMYANSPIVYARLSTLMFDYIKKCKENEENGNTEQEK